MLWIFIFFFAVRSILAPACARKPRPPFVSTKIPKAIISPWRDFNAGSTIASAANPQQLGGPERERFFDGSWREENLGDGLFECDWWMKVARSILTAPMKLLRGVFYQSGDRRVGGAHYHRQYPGLDRSRRFAPHQWRRERLLSIVSTGLFRQKRPLRRRRASLGQGRDAGVIFWRRRRSARSPPAKAADRARANIYRRQSHRPGQPAHRAGGGDSRLMGCPGKMPGLCRGTQKLSDKTMAICCRSWASAPATRRCKCLCLPTLGGCR